MEPKMSDCTSGLGEVCEDPACPVHKVIPREVIQDAVNLQRWGMCLECGAPRTLKTGEKDGWKTNELICSKNEEHGATR